MNLENLTLVDGLSREEIMKKLGKEKIRFNVFYNEKAPFFKKTNIDLNLEWSPSLSGRNRIEESKIWGIFGFPDYFRHHSYHYYARYKIEEGFDFSKLDGKITFSDGLLVESTQINF